jgi:hypothetical protein
MKLLLSAALLLAAALSVSAQRYDTVTLSSAATVAATATSNYTAVVSVRGANSLALLTTCTLNGAGTDDIIFKFSKSLNGSTFETTPSILITNVANGTTAVNKISVVDASGVHSIKLASIINGSAAQVLTNSVVAGVRILP